MYIYTCMYVDMCVFMYVCICMNVYIHPNRRITYKYCRSIPTILPFGSWYLTGTNHFRRNIFVKVEMSDSIMLSNKTATA